MIRDELTKQQRWALADKLAEDRLDAINSVLDDVHPSENFYALYGKRIVDIVVSGLALVVTSPINLVAFLITFFDVGRPIFFKQSRIGKDGKVFTLIKFRNMTNERDEKGELLPSKQRVTRFGKFMRKTSMDELLNFVSVFKGDMSIIGPRPLVPEYTHRYNKRHRARLAVRPGLECPPRTIGKTVWTWQDQFENDVWYVENLSFSVDCRMFINLVKFAFDRKSANARAVAGRGMFIGYDLDGVAINLEQAPKEYVDYAKALGSK